MGAIKWSKEKPKFVLETHESFGDDIHETELYGEDHTLTFVSGKAEEPASFHMGMVFFKVGAPLKKRLPGRVVTSFTAQTVFPHHRSAENKGLLLSSTEPSSENLELIANGLLHALSERHHEVTTG